MMAHFYLSSRFSNTTNVKKVATDLLNLNFSQTYDWTTISQVTSMEQLKTIGKEELKGIQAADFLVLLTPAGKSSHVEMGIALASNLRVYVHSFDSNILSMEETSVFYHLPNVTIVVGDLKDLIDYIVVDQRQ